MNRIHRSDDTTGMTHGPAIPRANDDERRFFAAGWNSWCLLECHKNKSLLAFVTDDGCNGTFELKMLGLHFGARSTCQWNWI